MSYSFGTFEFTRAEGILETAGKCIACSATVPAHIARQALPDIVGLLAPVW